jgi:hypothetical protein
VPEFLEQVLSTKPVNFNVQGSVMTVDRCAAAEGFYKLALAYAPVPDLHIMWLLHLCDAHQEMQSWAEAAQCAVAVAGVIMQVLI